MKITATLTTMGETKVGDVLSSYGQSYWDSFLKGDQSKSEEYGASVYVRSPIKIEDGVIESQAIYKLTFTE